MQQMIDCNWLTEYLQGPYALCRVIKKNEPKTSDSQGEGKLKQVGSSSNIGNVAPVRVSNEPVVISDDIPMQASYIESNYSIPVTPPYQTTAMGEYKHSSTYSSFGTNPASLLVSPDMILDSSKVKINS